MTAAGTPALSLAATAIIDTPSPPPFPHHSGANNWDLALFRLVNNLCQHTRWLHQPLRLYAQFGMALLVLLLIGAWWLARRRGSVAVMAATLWTAAAAVIAEGAAHLIQPLADEARPWRNVPHALILVGHSSQYSFPSGDGVVTGALVAGLLLYQRRYAIVVAVAGLADCFGWVYIGAHYPQDVAGGLVIGAVVVLGGWALLRDRLIAAVERLSTTRLRGLLMPAAAAAE